MTSKELREKYIDFFKNKDHVHMPSASLIPENDPTALFISAGMHPLVPYLSGEKHPQGKRLVSYQKCIRTVDIDNIGDETHNTFFEMLGNWSLGAYFKKESIQYSYEFLTEALGLDSANLYITVFEGDEDAPRDEETAQLWEKAGIAKDHIFYLPKEDNWWGPVGETGPCGPDSEIFYDADKDHCSPDCKPGCGCGKYFEIWNNVFMEYHKDENGKYTPLKQKNIDTGMGIERTLVALNKLKNIFECDTLKPIYDVISKDSKHENKQSIRIVTDHFRAATFLVADGVTPSNLDQGYILRRLVRRAIRHLNKLGIQQNIIPKVADTTIEIFKDAYPELLEKRDNIIKELEQEKEKFEQALVKGLKEFNKLEQVTGKDAFILFSTYGFPLELTEELVREKGQKVNKKEFQEEFKKHQELSRQGTDQKFRGGLADDTEEVTQLHTATHLLHTALRQVLGEHVEQKGSNITKDRLRFDFSHPDKMTPEEKGEVEKIVNDQIKKKLPVEFSEMTVEEAKKQKAIGLFESKYGNKVKVYTIGDFSKEICGGPHISNTNELGKFRIKKEESSSAGIRRIKAVLDI